VGEGAVGEECSGPLVHERMNYAQPAPQAQMPARLEGSTLVVQNGAAFPDVCLKCGTRHAVDRRHQKFAFVPMWARFFGPLFQLMFMKKSEFYLPICGTCNAEWKKWNLIAWVSWLPGVLLFMMGSAIGDQAGGFIVMFGMLALLAGLITALMLRLRHVVVVNKIDATSSWMTRIHPTALQVIFQPAAAAYAAAPQGMAYGAPVLQQGYAQYPQA